MAAANESQGLKIAVAAFVSLTVILAVTSYFLYSSYDKAEALRAAADDKASKAGKAASDALSQRDELRKLVGTRADEPESYLTEIKAEQKKADEKIINIVQKVDEVVKKAQAAGAQGPELQEARDTAKRLVMEYQGEVNKNYISTVNRLADILENESILATALSTNYTANKRNLEQANQVNEASLSAQTEAAKKEQNERMAENENHTKARADLLKKVDELQTENARQATELANLNTQLTQWKEKFEKTVGLDQQRIREYRDALDKNETVLDVPGGKITYVDYSRYEARTDITRGMGAHPQLVLSVFDRNAAGIPTEKPKGKIELIWVGDRYSLARIDKTYSPTNPIRAGDVIYSPAWSPNKPTEFALIGKIDVNRDSRDDRDDLKRLIQAAGGVVTYDLPPPEAGKERGKLTGRESYYVIDEEPPLQENLNKSKENSAEYKEFFTKRSEAMREARQMGVKPMRKERLLRWLGYDFAAPVRGGAEAMDMNTMKMLTRPRQSQTPKPAAAPAEKAADDNEK